MKTWLCNGCVFFFVFLQVSVDDAASLCSLAPSPQGLTNDDEVGVQSADGVSDSHVRVKLPLNRWANKFDRGFPSVDDTASYARAYQAVMTADKRRRSRNVETYWRCFILPCVI